MKLLIELEILTIASSIVWFDILGGHRLILKLIGLKPWDHIKPWTCWFCTQQWIGMILIVAYQLVYGLNWHQLILFLCINIVASKLMDSKFGFDIGLRGQIEELEQENKRLKK